MLSSVFFVVSPIPIPVPPTTAHLLLTGLIGLILGWAAFPAILVALVLQAIFFGHGGLCVLGLNTLNMALPAILCFYLFKNAIRRAKTWTTVLVLGALAGAVSIITGAALFAFFFLLTGDHFLTTVKAALIAHIPVVAIKAVVTAFIVNFVHQVKPELFQSPVHLRKPKESVHA